MIKIFDTLEKYNTYTNNGQELESGFLYYVKEDGSTHYYTNNIDGVSTIYDNVETPTGNIEITENGEDIDIAQYATATVNVASQSGFIETVDNYTETSLVFNKMIKSIDIPNSVTSIGNSAFNGCSGLTSINIPSGVTSIGQYAFRGCNGLTSITIPNSVTSIGSSAFSSCRGLTSIVVDSGNTKYDSRNNCNAIIETATNTLIQGCNTTVIPDTVTIIDNNAFQYMRNTSNTMTIPNSVTTIGNYAFGDAFSTVIIGTGVTSIGNNAFEMLNSTGAITINSVTLLATTPPTITSTTFYVPSIYTPYPIYVPAESVDTYKAASGWSTYAYRIQAI